MKAPSDRPTIPAQLVIPPALTSTAGVLVGFAAYMLGEERLGVWFYPVIAVAVVVWFYGQSKLLQNVRAFAREQRERQQDDLNA